MTSKERRLCVEASLQGFEERLKESKEARERIHAYQRDYMNKIKQGIYKARPHPKRRPGGPALD